MKPGAFMVALALSLAMAPSTHAFDLQGHRGARGLLPENTLAGFRKALEIGVTTLETDLAVTKDDVVVISHDPDLNPAIVRDGLTWIAQRGPAIRTLTFAELSRYDVGRLNMSTGYGKQWPLQAARDGERFPTLEQVLALGAGNGVRFNIETKIAPNWTAAIADPPTFARLVVDVVRKAGMSARTTIQSFDWRTLVEVRRIAPEIEIACLTQEGGNGDTVKPDSSGRSPWHAGLSLADHGGSVPKLVRAAGCDVWSANHPSLTRERVAEAKAEKLKVLAWTVNDAADMSRLIDMGVDGIITDYPDRLRKVMQEKGLAPPEAIAPRS